MALRFLQPKEKCPSFWVSLYSTWTPTVLFLTEMIQIEVILLSKYSNQTAPSQLWCQESRFLLSHLFLLILVHFSFPSSAQLLNWGVPQLKGTSLQFDVLKPCLASDKWLTAQPLVGVRDETMSRGAQIPPIPFHPNRALNLYHHLSDEALYV